MRKRLLRIIAGLLLLLVGGVAILAGVMLYPLYKQLPAPTYPEPQSNAEANRQDLAYLQQLPTVDRSFTPETRLQFQQAIDNLLVQADTMDRATLEMGVAKAIAIADNGHTNAHGVSHGYNLPVVPLRFAWFQEGLFIIKSDAAHTDLLGAQVLAIADQDPTELVPILRPYVGGTAEFAREFTPYFLIAPATLHAINMSPLADALPITVRHPDGSQHEYTIAVGDRPALEPTERRIPKLDLSPVSQPNDGRVWHHLLDDLPELPLYLRYLDRKYWQTTLGDPPVYYVQINSVTDQAGEQPLTAFLQQVLDEVAQQQPQYVVVDLRFNPGGNYERTMAFTEKLPTLLPASGKVFILTSNATFSAAIVTASRLKYFASAQAEIVGDLVGDRQQMWGEGGGFTLPNSQITIRYATGYHDWENGCRLSEFRYCFFLNYLFGVPAGQLSPTIAAPLSFADYVAGEDSGLNAVARHIQAATNP